jgi:pyrimidine deaminase RibD-like protein
VSTEFDYVTSQSVIISHGSNQVNATRDATRHAECVAIDRLLSGGMMSDKNRLPQEVIETAYPQSNDTFHDIWLNIPNCPTHWKNSYGWGSNTLFSRNKLRECDLYVTVEPCISKYITTWIIFYKNEFSHNHCFVFTIVILKYSGKLCGLYILSINNPCDSRRRLY